MSDPDAPASALPVPRPQGAPIPGEDRIAGPVPFGLGEDKAHPVVALGQALWEHRDRLPHAWRVLSQGVCDECSLGPRGLRDDVTTGVHLCTRRLDGLRKHTTGPLVPADLVNIDRLRTMDDDALAALGRLPAPFLHERGDRGFRRLSWEDALAYAGARIAATRPERMGVLAGGRGLTNEASYAVAKAARLLGSNNVDLCARLGHAATFTGLGATLGVAGPTCSLSDLIGTDLLLLIGTQLGEHQPVALRYLAEAKKRGTRVVVVNPTRAPELDATWVPGIPRSAVFGTRLMDDYVQIRAGGDVAFLNGVLKAVIDRGAVDRDHVAQHTTGFPALREALTAQDWPTLEAHSGVSRARMAWVAELYSRARTAVTVYSTGLTRHPFGVDNVEAVVNLHLARGMIGREKCGIMPLHGHPLVQGGVECGLAPATFPGGRPVGTETAAALSALWGGHPVPERPGLSTHDQLRAADRGELDLLYIAGGDLRTTLPDPAAVARAVARVGLRIHQDTELSRGHLLEPGEAVLLLPSQTRYEQRGGGTITSAERRIRFSPEIPGRRIGEARPAWQIPGQLAVAARSELAAALSYTDSQEIRDELERTVPAYKGIAALRKAGDWVQWGGPRLCGGGACPDMPDGRARFTALALPEALPEALPDAPPTDPAEAS